MACIVPVLEPMWRRVGDDGTGECFIEELCLRARRDRKIQDDGLYMSVPMPQAGITNIKSQKNNFFGK